MNYFNLNQKSVFTVRPAHRSAQAGLQAGPVAEEAGLRADPNRGQAGAAPEAACLVAGPGRAPGRSRSRANRPPGRSGRCPGRKHGDRVDGDAAGDDHDGAALRGKSR